MDIEQAFYHLILSACNNKVGLPKDFVISRCFTAVNPYAFHNDMITLANSIVQDINKGAWDLQRNFDHPLPTIQKMYRNIIYEDRFIVQLGTNLQNEVVCTVAGVVPK